MAIDRLREKYYSPMMFDNDGFFREFIYNNISGQHAILDLGAGAGEQFEYDLKGINYTYYRVKT